MGLFGWLDCEAENRILDGLHETGSLILLQLWLLVMDDNLELHVYLTYPMHLS